MNTFKTKDGPETLIHHRDSDLVVPIDDSVRLREAPHLAYTAGRKEFMMTSQRMAVWMAAVMLLSIAPGFSQNQSGESVGQAVVTVLPKHDGELPPSVVNQDLSVKVNGKNAKVTKWAPIKSPEDKVELVLLIDNSARTSLGRQFEDIARFIKSLPPNTKAAIAYMENGRATFAAPLSADHAQVLSALHLPGGGTGTDASPYFSLSDLAKSWPSQDREARREVVMVTDGVDNYNRRFDPEDPYVQAAITDAVRARVVVYSIYWQNQGRADQSVYASNAGQNLLVEVADATGGRSFWQGTGNPVSFEPYFEELSRRLRNQYELGFTSVAGGKPEVESFKLKLSAPGTEVDAPQQVLVTCTEGQRF